MLVSDVPWPTSEVHKTKVCLYLVYPKIRSMFGGEPQIKAGIGLQRECNLAQYLLLQAQCKADSAKQTRSSAANVTQFVVAKLIAPKDGDVLIGEETIRARGTPTD